MKEIYDSSSCSGGQLQSALEHAGKYFWRATVLIRENLAEPAIFKQFLENEIDVFLSITSIKGNFTFNGRTENVAEHLELMGIDLNLLRTLLQKN